MKNKEEAGGRDGKEKLEKKIVKVIMITLYVYNT